MSLEQLCIVALEGPYVLALEEPYIMAALPQQESLPVLVLNRRLGGLKIRSGRFVEEKKLLLLQVVHPVVQ